MHDDCELSLLVSGCDVHTCFKYSTAHAQVYTIRPVTERKRFYFAKDIVAIILSGI